MPSVDPSAVLDALRSVKDPDLHRDIVALGFVKDLQIDRGRVAFTIELTTPACPVKDAMRDQARSAVSATSIVVTSSFELLNLTCRTVMPPGLVVPDTKYCTLAELLNPLPLTTTSKP
jgi:ATP-binding protein involved in chromosome partitioning